MQSALENLIVAGFFFYMFEGMAAVYGWMTRSRSSKKNIEGENI